MTEKDIEKTKRIGNYEIKFKTTIDEASGDFVVLKVNYTADLQELVKKACCLDLPTTQFQWVLGLDNEGRPVKNTAERYKVKGVVYSGITDQHKELAFIKALVDTGEATIQFLDVSKIEDAIYGFKAVASSIIRTLTQYADLDASVKFDVKVKD
jgi:hypothetical protein